MKNLMLLVPVVVISIAICGCVSMAIKAHDMVVVLKSPDNAALPIETNKYAPVSDSSKKSIESPYGVLVMKHHGHSYADKLIQEYAYEEMYNLCEGKYEIIEKHTKSKTEFVALYNSYYDKGTGGGNGFAGNITQTVDIFLFNCVINSLN
jgi:hypothetical protein